MSIFNGKCLIRFSYRRENGAWKLQTGSQEYVIDSRVREFIKDSLGRIDCIDLPNAARRDPDRLPFIHLGLFLRALSVVKLDGGGVSETYPDAWTTEGALYMAVITVEQRKENYRAG